MTQKNPVPIDPSRIFPTVIPGGGGGKAETRNKNPKTHKIQNKQHHHKTKPNQTNYAAIWFISLVPHCLAYPNNDLLYVIILQIFASTLFPAATSFTCVQN